MIVKVIVDLTPYKRTLEIMFIMFRFYKSCAHRVEWPEPVPEPEVDQEQESDPGPEPDLEKPKVPRNL